MTIPAAPLLRASTRSKTALIVPDPLGICGTTMMPSLLILATPVLAMILAALDSAGGVDYLTRQAETNPAAFMTLLGKVLPLQVGGRDEGPITICWQSESVDRL
jgi:hypothetical protein